MASKCERNSKMMMWLALIAAVITTMPKTQTSFAVHAWMHTKPSRQHNHRASPFTSSQLVADSYDSLRTCACRRRCIRSHLRMATNEEQLPSQVATKERTKPAASGSPSVFELLCAADVVDPSSNRACKALTKTRNDNTPFAGLFTVFGKGGKSERRPTEERKTMVIVMEQLGDFDSAEYAEQLCAVLPDLKAANIDLRIIGIGDCQTARMFSEFTGMPLSTIRMDPAASIHKALGLHRGPNWDIPSIVPTSLLLWFAKEVGAANAEERSIDTKHGDSHSDGTMSVETARGVARAWLNYMAMCAGVAAPGTLPEIIRGYIGDRSAPERLAPNEMVVAGPIEIKGITDVKLGPIQYQSLWKNEKGYQRPAELATVRLRSMVEVLSNFSEYVPDQTLLDWRGATFIFDADGSVEYEYRNHGVLTYSKTMARPLSFLEPYIGNEKALNPLGLSDENYCS